MRPEICLAMVNSLQESLAKVEQKRVQLTQQQEGVLKAALVSEPEKPVEKIEESKFEQSIIAVLERDFGTNSLLDVKALGALERNKFPGMNDSIPRALASQKRSLAGIKKLIR